MNKIKMLMVLGLCGIIAAAMPLHAEEKGHQGMDMKEAKKPEKMKMPQTIDGIWEAIHKEHAELDEAALAFERGVFGVEEVHE